MAKAKGIRDIIRPVTTPKKSSSSGKPSMVKMSSMNKDKKQSYKKYRGQGR